MVVYLLTIGLISILGQVVLLRELNVAFYGIELIYLLALGIWLFWTAFGALIGRLVKSPSSRHIAALFIIFGIILLLDFVFIRASRILFGAIPGAYLNFPQQLIIAVISMLPAGLLSGLLFQLTAKVFVTANKTLATAYAIESAGGLIGGLFSTLFIMSGLQNFFIVLLCSLCSVIAPFIVLRENSRLHIRWLTIILVCIFLALLWNASFIDRRMTMWNHPNILESSDSPYGRITVTKRDHQISVFENDALSFETEGLEAESLCHLAVLQHHNPQNVLILGGGIEGMIREIEKYKPARIDYIELNPVMLNLATKHLPDDIRESLQQPNVNIIIGDPRQYLKKSSNYDLILIGMPQPSSGQANRFYTYEFFEQCSEKLNSGGIIAFRLVTPENLWTAPLLQRNTSIYKALKSVFPETLFLPGTTSVITASRSPLPSAPEIMTRRWQNYKIATRLISPNYINYVFTNDRFFKIRDLLKNGKELPNTDTRPVCYQYAFFIWLSKFFPSLALVDTSLITNKISFKPILLFLCTAIFIIFLLGRLRPGYRRIMLVSTAGFIGMVLETILVLYYQVKNGVLYQDIGWLLMIFMVGLALGATIIKTIMTRQTTHQKILYCLGITLIIGFCLLCLFTGIIVKMSIFAGLVEISFLLLATGFLVSGIFAYASLHKIEDQKEIISPLYSADLVGGCLGSFIGSLILIPLAGMDICAWGMLVLAVFSILLV